MSAADRAEINEAIDRVLRVATSDITETQVRLARRLVLDAIKRVEDRQRRRNRTAGRRGRAK